mmetsp:Transcript_51015/g.100278  ORF Transcript_51015/g.100278 Transcript_51015/m.100278 type:complete len:171 (-) Transcript_51015:186-698(-)
MKLFGPRKGKGEKRGLSGITIGDVMPEFSGVDQNGKTFSSKDVVGQKHMVVFFYPNDFTYICTQEACSFRDSYEKFRELNAEVVGISANSPDSHRNFSEQNQLPFSLLADEDRTLRNLFGVPPAMLGMADGRVTYVVDKGGRVCFVFAASFQGDKHALEALRAVQDLQTS